MKCESCGHNLSLEDKICPYCGKENKFAKKHNKDMAKFEKDYNSVKSEVLENSRRFNTLTVRITIIAVLIALTAVMAVCIGNSFDIRYAREQKIISRNSAGFREEIYKFIDERDYCRLYFFYRTNRLEYSDNFMDLYITSTSSTCYIRLLEGLYDVMSEDSYTTDEEAMEHIASAMERMLEIRDPKSDYERKKYYTNEKATAFVNDLVTHSETLLRGYFNLSEEDIKEFETMSKARKQVMLEEGLKNAEKK
ncbi:MAG: zinc ribbon domain-containing protein [Lachnospiraceae bacterium]|nr:zinc ribbon domain-containing protein [Lachnospiraceae bacterium]